MFLNLNNKIQYSRRGVTFPKTSELFKRDPIDYDLDPTETFGNRKRSLLRNGKKITSL